jgi:hypothetical protein
MKPKFSYRQDNATFSAEETDAPIHSGRAMLTCLPQSLCSWNYRILGAAADDATVTFR